MYNPINSGSITTDASGVNLYAYSCLIMTGSTTQTFLKKLDIATGALQALVEIQSNLAVGC
jgi:hypothetical protein